MPETNATAKSMQHIWLTHTEMAFFQQLGKKNAGLGYSIGNVMVMLIDRSCLLGFRIEGVESEPPSLCVCVYVGFGRFPLQFHLFRLILFAFWLMFATGINQSCWCRS